MSIITIEQPRGQAGGTRRRDVKIEEGQVVQERHDIKGDIVGAAIGTGGGTLIGAVFSHVARGFGFGLAGSAIYTNPYGQHHHRAGSQRQQRLAHHRQPLTFPKKTNAPRED
jgi:hypothetical protein